MRNTIVEDNCVQTSPYACAPSRLSQVIRKHVSLHAQWL